MRLKPDSDITKFLLSIKRCQGAVYYESTEGDILNLASTLSQYVFCSIANQPDLWSNGIIRCDNEEDYKIIGSFLCEDNAS